MNLRLQSWKGVSYFRLSFTLFLLSPTLTPYYLTLIHSFYTLTLVVCTLGSSEHHVVGLIPYILHSIQVLLDCTCLEHVCTCGNISGNSVEIFIKLSTNYTQVNISGNGILQKVCVQTKKDRFDCDHIIWVVLKLNLRLNCEWRQKLW